MKVPKCYFLDFFFLIGCNLFNFSATHRLLGVLEVLNVVHDYCKVSASCFKRVLHCVSLKVNSKI